MMQNKLFFCLLLLFSLLSQVIEAAIVTHPASQITVSTFGSGDYIFPNKLTVSGDATLMSTLYTKQVSEQVSQGGGTNLALGKSYTYSRQPDGSYPDNGGELTDGSYGCGNWPGPFVGWQNDGNSYSVTIDLGSIQSIGGTKIFDVYHPPQGSGHPGVVFSTSTDNSNFINWDITPTADWANYCTTSSIWVMTRSYTGIVVTARYVRFTISNSLQWLHLSELEVLSSGEIVTNTYNRVGIGTSTPAYNLDIAGTAQASTFQTSSDERFKSNVLPLTGVLPKLNNIHPVSFDWSDLYKTLGRATPGRQVGLIAQDVEKVFPELVSSLGAERYRDIDYGRMSAILLQAIKEQQAELETLRTELAQFKACNGLKNYSYNTK